MLAVNFERPGLSSFTSVMKLIFGLSHLGNIFCSNIESIISTIVDLPVPFSPVINVTFPKFISILVHPCFKIFIVDIHSFTSFLRLNIIILNRLMKQRTAE